MSPEVSDLLKRALALSVDERAALANTLLDSLETRNESVQEAWDEDSDFGTFDLEKVRAWPRTVERGVGGAFQMAGLLGRNSFPSPSRG